MSHGHSHEVPDEIREYSSVYLSRIGLMIATAVIISAALIKFFNDTVYQLQVNQMANTVELMVTTLFPYMVSAVVAAVTAIAVMSIIPVMRSGSGSRKIQLRLRELARGNLATGDPIDCSNPYLRDIASELNRSVAVVGGEFAKLKIINRQQWDLLETVRSATKRGDTVTALRFIDKIEENWSRIAEIEERFRT